jgi:hypothetical protein
MCKHEGFYTCIGQYDRRAGRLVYYMVCDDCHATLRPVMEQAYKPNFVDGFGTPGHGATGAAPQAA